MLTTSFAHVSMRFAGRSRLVAAGVVVAAAVAALLFGDSHSIGMTHN